MLPLILAGPALQAQTYKSKAERHEARNQYREASRVYLGLHESGDEASLLKGAMNLYKGRLFEEALPYFRKADSLGIMNNQEDIFAYFECLKTVGKYNDADDLMKRHAGGFAGSRQISLHVDKMPYYDKLRSYAGAKVTRLGFNTEFSEMGPTVYEQWLYFVSTVPTSGNREVHRINMQPFYNLYAVPQESDMKKMVRPKGDFGKKPVTIKYGNMETPSLPNTLNSKHHDGPICVTPSGNVLVYTSNWTQEKRPKRKEQEINLLLYFCTRNEGVWSKPASVPFNSFDWSNQHGFFDEQKSVLYFSSNMPGGEGGFDIWKATYNNGTWGTPLNLGPKVNSPKDEVFPSVSPDGTVFFSSNGWPGLGGLDVFLIDDPEEDPVNATGAINTEKDDFGLYFTSERLANMTSNRIGSVGDDDIYGVELDVEQLKEFMRPPPPVVTGEVKDSITGEPLSNVRVTLSGHFDYSYVTPPDGRLTDVNLPMRKGDPQKTDLFIRYEKDGYEPREVKLENWPVNRQPINITGGLVRKQERLVEKSPVPGAVKQPDAKKQDQPLVQIRIMENQRYIIYFDYDRFNIRKDASEILAKVAYVLLEEYEAAEVTMTGHTDTRGSVDYNEQLSKNRVESAKKWLIQRGVAAKRIRTAWMGERQPAVMCKNPLDRERNPDRCLSEAEHQLNRRVEMELLNR